MGMNIMRMKGRAKMMRTIKDTGKEMQQTQSLNWKN